MVFISWMARATQYPNIVYLYNSFDFWTRKKRRRKLWSAWNPLWAMGIILWLLYDMNEKRNGRGEKKIFQFSTWTFWVGKAIFKFQVFQLDCNIFDSYWHMCQRRGKPTYSIFEMRHPHWNECEEPKIIFIMIEIIIKSIFIEL